MYLKLMKRKPVRQDSHRNGESYSLIIVAPGQYEIEICFVVFLFYVRASKWPTRATRIANKVCVYVIVPGFLSIKLDDESIQCKNQKKERKRGEREKKRNEFHRISVERMRKFISILDEQILTSLFAL